MMKHLSLPIAIAVLTFASVAMGQTQDPREIQARRDCLTGKVESGAALLAEMFIETNKPAFIYNQGRCYEQNGRAEEAINRFREYLRLAKKLSREDRADADQHIADCQAILAEKKSAPLPTPIQPAAGTSQPPPAAATANQVARPPTPLPAPAPVEPSLTGAAPAPPIVNESANPTPAQPANGAGLHIAGIAIGGAGMAALVSGGIFSYLVSSAKQKAEDNAKNQVYDSSLNSRGHNYQTLQWVSYGAGAGLLATGAVLYALGVRRNSQTTTMSLIPAVVPGQTGVLLQGRY